MKITKAQLKRIIKEELESPDDIIASYPDPEGKNPDQVIYRWQQDEFDHREKVLKSTQALDFLKMKAKDYHNDPTLNPGDIKALLQDDFMDSQYPKFFGMHEGEPSIAEFIEQYAAGEELNEVKKVKITKSQLKQIIKEELGQLQLSEDGHMDVPSARRKLKTSIEDAGQILQALEQMGDEGELPSWWMDKVTLSANYLNKARDYILVDGN